jgi:hypothetical protein
MILKSGNGICNHCISNFYYRNDLDEREKTYFKDVIEKRKRKLNFDLNKEFLCIQNNCKQKY